MSNRMVGNNEIQVIGICWECVHKHSMTSTCDAFPKGIPREIVNGHYDHHSPFSGDNGIQFEEDTTLPSIIET